jgi:hypothetical protein
MSRHAENIDILLDTDLSTTANSKPFSTKNLDAVSIQAVWTGTASGTFKVQESNDRALADGVNQPAPTNWTDVTGSSVAIAGGAGSPLTFDIAPAAALWYRVVWTRTGSSGTLTSLRVNGKGAG